METKTEAILPSDVQMIESEECLLCANCRCNKQVSGIILSYMYFVIDYICHCLIVKVLQYHVPCFMISCSAGASGMDSFASWCEI